MVASTNVEPMYKEANCILLLKELWAVAEIKLVVFFLAEPASPVVNEKKLRSEENE